MGLFDDLLHVLIYDGGGATNESENNCKAGEELKERLEQWNLTEFLLKAC